MISAIFLKIMKFITIFLLSVLVISCETTSPITSPEIIPEPEQKIIYEPKEEVQVIEEKEERKIKDFSNIKSFEGKKVSSLQEQYGDFNFSKLEQTFEFHRYNAEKCRIFIQNYTSNKLIIHITIYDLQTGSVYDQYDHNLCS
jgi:GH35 family endo-1,4-beta-xylanase